MPAKAQVEPQLHTLVDAVSDIVHAAGVTSALSYMTALRIVDVSRSFFGGKSEVQPIAAPVCNQLRDLRLERRRYRRARQKLIALAQGSPPPSIQSIAATTGTSVQQPAAPAADTEFAAWLVQLKAELEVHIGANTPEEAITIAAQKLPESIVFAKAIKEQPL